MVDVQLSADGVPVVLHDGNLWRLAGENRNVADLTAEELTSLPLLPTGYGQAGEHIPTLEQVLRASWACWWSSSPRAATAPP